MRRVVITGLGIVSNLGTDLTSVSEALRGGKSGIRLIPERMELGISTALSGEVTEFPMPELPKRFQKQLSRNGRMAVSAAVRAVADAGLSRAEIRGERSGAIVGNDGNIGEIYKLLRSKFADNSKLPLLALARSMTSSVSANLSILFGLRGHCFTNGAACASGSVAIGEAARLIALGEQDYMIAGGVHEGGVEIDTLFDALMVFSGREDHPQEASRPFDKHRDGLVPAGGCGILVLESHEAAVRRGATIKAELIGSAITADAMKIAAPSGEGGVRCMRLALRHAGLEADQIDYINAHATSTWVGDAIEARGIAEVFGDKPYVSSTKSMTGHEVAASGATELIYTILMMQGGFVAPNINIDEIDEDCRGIRIVANEALAANIDIAMSNSFGFGGINSSLIVARPHWK